MVRGPDAPLRQAAGDSDVRLEGAGASARPASAWRRPGRPDTPGMLVMPPGPGLGLPGNPVLSCVTNDSSL